MKGNGLPGDPSYYEPPNGRIGIGKGTTSQMVAEAELLQCVLVGMTLREASESMRASYWKIRKIARQPDFLLKVKEHSAEVAQRMCDELVTSQVDMAKKLEAASEAALEEMLQMMGESPNTSALKFKIAQDLLDRDPRSSRTKRIESTGTMHHDFISPAVLVHAAATAKELERFARPQVTNGDGSPDNPTDSGNGQG